MMNLHYFPLVFLLVITVNGAPKPSPIAGPNPNPDPKAMAQMAIIFNGGRQHVELPGTGRGPYDHNGNLYHGNGGFGNGGRGNVRSRVMPEFGAQIVGGAQSVGWNSMYGSMSS